MKLNERRESEHKYVRKKNAEAHVETSHKKASNEKMRASEII